MSNCTTHHHACDCREERFRKIEVALAEARKGLESYNVHEVGCCISINSRHGCDCSAQKAYYTLSTIDAILSEDERKEEG